MVHVILSACNYVNLICSSTSATTISVVKAKALIRYCFTEKHSVNSLLGHQLLTWLNQWPEGQHLSNNNFWSQWANLVQCITCQLKNSSILLPSKSWQSVLVQNIESHHLFLIRCPYRWCHLQLIYITMTLRPTLSDWCTVLDVYFPRWHWFLLLLLWWPWKHACYIAHHLFSIIPSHTSRSPTQFSCEDHPQLSRHAQGVYAKNLKILSMHFKSLCCRRGCLSINAQAQITTTDHRSADSTARYPVVIWQVPLWCHADPWMISGFACVCVNNYLVIHSSESCRPFGSQCLLWAYNISFFTLPLFRLTAFSSILPLLSRFIASNTSPHFLWWRISKVQVRRWLLKKN